MTTMLDDEATLSTDDVCRITGVTYRQLDYWIRAGALRPHVGANGTGTQRRFTTADARACRLAIRLRSLGVPIRMVGTIIEHADAAEWCGILIVGPDGAVGLGNVSAGWIIDIGALATPA